MKHLVLLLTLVFFLAQHDTLAQDFTKEMIPGFFDNSGQNELMASFDPVIETKLTISPNPVSTQTTIQFNLPMPEWTKVEVFNATGQRVKILLNAALDEGSHELNWYSNADGGNSLDTGFYLIRLSAGKTVVTKKAILAR